MKEGFKIIVLIDNGSNQILYVLLVPEAPGDFSTFCSLPLDASTRGSMSSYKFTVELAFVSILIVLYNEEITGCVIYSIREAFLGFTLGSQGFGGAHESIMLGQASPVAHLL